MKKLFLFAAAAVMILASCSKEGGGEGPDLTTATGAAYVSIKIDTRSQGRASGEEDGLPEESDLKKLYLITFSETGNVVAVPGSADYYNVIDATAQLSPNTGKKPAAVKISDASKNLVVIANPGAKLLEAIQDLTSSSTFGTFNAAIASVTTTDIVSTDGFAMITSPGDNGKATGEKILYPYVAIGDKIQVVDENTSDAIAKGNAEKDANRLPVILERLAAKLVVKAKSPAIVAPENATVTLTDWTVDAVNTTYYPFAEKTLLAVAHNDAVYYAKNFYTKDPNFYKDPDLGYAKGLAYATIGADYAPVLPFTNHYGWKAPGDASVPARIAYVIENTMAATDQVYGSATRIIMKATYYPEFDPAVGYVDGQDWFSWAGTYYPSLKALQDTYADAESATSALKAACDNFYDKIKAHKPSIVGTDFATLTPVDIDIEHGGQIVKDGNNPVIRWYRKGQCYYSYEIRHDNETTEKMAFAKYGVVRNNWYNLTLNSVNGPGTPWYPESTKPGPGDPDPQDPIDESTGYLGVSVEIAPWIFWETGMNDID